LRSSRNHNTWHPNFFFLLSLRFVIPNKPTREALSFLF
jgi:hypothetical protein